MLFHLREKSHGSTDDGGLPWDAVGGLRVVVGWHKFIWNRKHKIGGRVGSGVLRFGRGAAIFFASGGLGRSFSVTLGRSMGFLQIERQPRRYYGRFEPFTHTKSEADGADHGLSEAVGGAVVG